VLSWKDDGVVRKVDGVDEIGEIFDVQVTV